MLINYKENQKKSPLISMVLQYLQLQFICHAKSLVMRFLNSRQPCLIMDRQTITCLIFLTGFSFTSLEMLLYIKMRLLRISRYISNLQNAHHRAFLQSSENIELCRRAPRSCDWVSTWFLLWSYSPWQFAIDKTINLSV